MPRTMATPERDRMAAATVEIAVHWRVDGASLRRAGHWDHPGDDVTLTVALCFDGRGARAEATLSAGDAARAVAKDSAIRIAISAP